MKFNIKNLSTIICISLIYILSSYFPAFSEDNIVRAKIGIQVRSDKKYSMAKSRDRLKPGDLLRIYVHPEKASYIYVIYTDKKKVSLLNVVEQKILSSTLALPSVNEFYAVDGNSPFEKFTIICSSKELSIIDDFINSDNLYTNWETLENELIQKSRIPLTERSEVPFTIAGNIRGIDKSDADGSFERKLHIFSGKSFIVKQYEFRVKK